MSLTQFESLQLWRRLPLQQSGSHPSGRPAPIGHLCTTVPGRRGNGHSASQSGLRWLHQVPGGGHFHWPSQCFAFFLYVIIYRLEQWNICVAVKYATSFSLFPEVLVKCKNNFWDKCALFTAFGFSHWISHVRVCFILINVTGFIVNSWGWMSGKHVTFHDEIKTKI